ncbi:hypothetical protein [Micromonospora sp. LOL_024]|uniref:hypothetical protein n=1 Tax=Micromonospora sp. LOL_024 TaxID=3345412 RepID=UPI003A83BE0A
MNPARRSSGHQTLRPPSWPGPERPSRCIDVTVVDIESAEQAALALGARRAGVRVPVMILLMDNPVSDSIAALAGAFVGAARGLVGWLAEWAHRIEYAEQLAALAALRD